jgi:hypothetical protein
MIFLAAELGPSLVGIYGVEVAPGGLERVARPQAHGHRGRVVKTGGELYDVVRGADVQAVDQSGGELFPPGRSTLLPCRASTQCPCFLFMDR